MDLPSSTSASAGCSSSAPPTFLGWGIALTAARQRLAPLWPMLGMLAVALLGGMAKVNANRIEVLHGANHIHVGFTLDPAVQGAPFGLLHLVVLFALTALPYLLWQWRRVHSLSA